MADVVTTTIYENGPRRIVVGFTNLSDGTGEAGVIKVDATSTGPYGVKFQGQTFYPGVNLKLASINFAVSSMKLRLQWVASSNRDFLVIGDTSGVWPFLDRRAGFQGITCPAGLAGATGSIAFTTINANLNATYSVILELIKGVPQS